MKSKKITQKEILPQEVTLKVLASLIHQTNTAVGVLLEKVDFLREEMLFEFKAIEERFVKIEKRLDGIDVRLDKIEKRLDKVEVRLDTVEQKVDTMNVKFTKDFEKIYTNMINPYEFKSLVLKVEHIESSL